MLSLKNASIRDKIRRMILLTSGAALLLIGTVVITRDLINEPAEIKVGLSVIAEMTGNNIASTLVFQDPKAAEDILAALKAEPQIQHAYLFSADGRLFSGYCRHKIQCIDDSALLNLAKQWINTTSGNPSGTICEFKGTSLYLRYPVLSQSEPLGMLFIQADMTDLGKRLLLLVLTVIGGLLISLGAAYVLSIRFQRMIVDPVYSLKEKMGRVTRQRDYTTRATAFYPDEIGELFDGFNAMIEMIQTWDQALRDHGENLKQEVAQRTAELVAVNDTLTGTVADLRVARDDAQAASRAKSQFLANMSHEIRTPMIGVLGMTELLLTTGLDEKQRHLAETVLHSGNSLLNVLNDILDYSKIEVGKLKLESIDFDLRESVEDVMQLFAEKAHQKGIELVCQVSDAIPSVFIGDSGRLRQILTNLVGNAVKFTERGEVHVRVTAFEQGFLHFEIRDTGVGIAPEAQAHIFEVFSQEDGTTTRRYGGTGLGLAISKQLVEMMGGEIAVVSSPGSGSTFSFTLRLEISVLPMQPVTARHVSLKNMRVLVVDDNECNCDILHQQVLSWGMRNGCANNAQDAIAMLRKATAANDPYALAILDMMMPGMNGFELARAIKADPDIVAMPVILLTSLAEDSDMEALQQAGVSAYLTKPVRESQLYNCILTVAGQVSGSVFPNNSENAELNNPMVFSGLQVLLAEDNTVNQEVVREMLLSFGCHVKVVCNGQDALDALSTASYDIVFMDCQMPVMDGYTATRIIRENEAGAATGLPQQRQGCRRTLIIALTAHAMQGDRERCLVAGMDDYLGKPFTLDQLQCTLERWFPKKAPQNVRSAEGTVGGQAAQAEESSDADHVNVAALETLRSLQRSGMPDMLSKVIGIYLRDTPKLMENARIALERNDADTMGKQAHSMKSSSASLGAHALAELCKEMEAMGRAGTAENGADLLLRMEVEYALVAKILARELRSS